VGQKWAEVLAALSGQAEGQGEKLMTRAPLNINWEGRYFFAKEAKKCFVFNGSNTEGFAGGIVYLPPRHPGASLED
jgi:hypothetical protein